MFRTIVGAILLVEIGIPLLLCLLGSERSGCLWIGLAIIIIIIILV